MSINIRNYKQVTREYLLKILEKKKPCTEECKCCYEKFLYQKLKENGFFSHNKSINWWQIELDSNYEFIYSPIKDE